MNVRAARVSMVASVRIASMVSAVPAHLVRILGQGAWLAGYDTLKFKVIS